MLTVDDYELIRRKHLIDGESQRSIAEELGHSRNTVAKAVEHAIPPGYRLSRPRQRRVLEPVVGIIDGWVEQDRGRPRKQRHTAMRVWQRLRDEHGFGGDYSTVRRYLAQLERHRGEVFMPLAFEPGEEAQVDWHEGWVIENGQLRKVAVFVMTLSYSKASFEWPYERANLESFLDGHARAFDYFRGVPRRLAYDNLKSAVIQVQRGRERRLNERFVQLRSFYLFDTRFCQPARGNEKGDVENQVKRSERTYLTPPPDITEGGLAGLGAKLMADCDRDLDRAGPAPHGDKSRRQMLEEERRGLLALPAQRYEACVQRSTFVDKQALVAADTNRYSTPVRWAFHMAVVKLFADRVEVWCEQQKVAEHTRNYEKGQYVLEPMHYLPLLATKPGSLDNARPFKGLFGAGGAASGVTSGATSGGWGADLQLFRRELEYRQGDEGTRRYIDTLLLLTRYDESDVRHAVSLCVRRRAFAYEAVLGVLRNQPMPPRTQLDLSDRPHLRLVGDGIRPAALYDALRQVREEVVA